MPGFFWKLHPRFDFIFISFNNYKNKENVSNILSVYAVSIFQMYTNLMQPCAISVF